MELGEGSPRGKGMGVSMRTLTVSFSMPYMYFPIPVFLRYYFIVSCYVKTIFRETIAVVIQIKQGNGMEWRKVA